MSQTNVHRDYDSVFPGENWFFYWKTSPSLWEHKLREHQGGNPIFVPINWAFHVQSQDNFDFADVKPETDLKRLFIVCKNLGREIVFLMPLGPQPYLPNGGLPNFLAQTLSLDRDGMAIATIDTEERINKIYSFFDPRVYQSFRKFVWHLGQYFSLNGITSSVFGLKTGYVRNGQFTSYIEDSSVVFEQAFARFLKQQMVEKGRTVDSVTAEEKLHFQINFGKLINELYTQSAKESIGNLWAGELEFAFLGGSQTDLIARSSYLWENPEHYFDGLFDIIGNKVIPSSALLGFDQKSSVLVKAFQDFLTSGFLYKKIDNEVYEDDYLTTYSPLVHFELYHPPMLSTRYPEKWNELGVIPYLKREYKWSYNFNFELNVTFDETYSASRTHLFSSFGLVKEDFSKIIKLFLNGAKIIWDLSNIDPELEKKLELFYLENNISTEKINFTTTVTNASLGDGRLITFKGDDLLGLNVVKKMDFWRGVVSYLQIKHLKIEDEDDTFYFWKFRTPKHHELNYEQIRRVSLYNPSGFKKRARVLADKNFALLKVIDEIGSKIKPGTMGVEIELSPGGSVSLDFGYFE